MTELETLVEKCLDEHGEPKDGATHGEMERILYLKSQKKAKEAKQSQAKKAKSPSSL